FKVILREKHFDYHEIFNLTKARNLDDNSLQTIRRQRIDPVAEAINYEQEISEEVKEKKMASLLRANVFSKVEINNHVTYLLDSNDRIKASQIPLESNEDFVKLILIFLFSKSVGMKYDIKVLNYEAKIGE